MKFLITLIVAVAVFFTATAEQSQAQCYGGRSGFVGVGSGFGGFGGGGFSRSVGGFGGFGNRGFVSSGFSSFRPVYSYSRPVYSYSRPVYSGGFSRGFSSGGFRRGCGY